MAETRTVAFAKSLGAWWRALGVLAWLAGIAAQLQQEALFPALAYRWGLALGAMLVVVLLGAMTLSPGSAWRECCRRSLKGRVGRLFVIMGRIAWAVLTLSAIAILGFSFAGWRADNRLADALAPQWEGRDIELVGVIDEMPQWRAEGLQFAFTVESARLLPMAAKASTRVASSRRNPSANQAAPSASATLSSASLSGIPSRVWLSWRHENEVFATDSVPLRAGQRWRLPVRLRQPHGAMNPHGFDTELWMFEKGLRATGTVRSGGQLLEQRWAPIERVRQSIRDRLLLSGMTADADSSNGVSVPLASSVLAALAVGDQAAINTAGWELFRDTGVAHLMSISGLHITLLAWLGAHVVGAVWRRSARAPLYWATPGVARWGGVLLAWLYALLAGWGIPAQRTVIMLFSNALLRGAGLSWPPTLVTLASTIPVTLLDPWALLQPGFWLSFAAVGLLIVAEPARVAPAAPLASRGDAALDERAPRCRYIPRLQVPIARLSTRMIRAARGAVRAQVIASIGLAPLSLITFGQISLVGLIANLLAGPWVTLLVTPLALVSTVLPSLSSVAVFALRPLLWLLGLLARWPCASVHVAAASTGSWIIGLIGGVVVMLPLPWVMRLLGLPLLLPLVAPAVVRPAPGYFELVVADVGQGSAILVRTAQKLLLFDAGPRLGEDSDAGQRMLLPLLQARGEPRVDILLLSHADSDHVAGAQTIMDHLPVMALHSSLPENNPLRQNTLPHTRCTAGQTWNWDGVQFTMLHPQPADYRNGAKTNVVSCVLRIVDVQNRSILLTGDMEAAQEAALVAREGSALRSTLLLAPHHGSRTSSTDAFLAAVNPGVVVVQAGYRNRYGHPAQEVLARYQAHGIAVVRTDHCGAWSWTDGVAICTRSVRRRYWQWRE